MDSLHQVRYFFEHQLLPKFFYEQQYAFLNALLEKENFLYEVISDIFKDNDMENPYKPEEFDFKVLQFEDSDMDGINVFQLIFPEPKSPTLCHRAYMFFQPSPEKFGLPLYFTIEKSNGINDATDLAEVLKAIGLSEVVNDNMKQELDNPFLCAWDPFGNHRNFGHTSLDDDDDLMRCIAIYTNALNG